MGKMRRKKASQLKDKEKVGKVGLKVEGEEEEEEQEEEASLVRMNLPSTNHR